LIDKDGDGYLVKDEIVGAFGGTEESIHDEIMNECDLNQDGKISRS
jgi:Ca2+-binding EF-hand superfamily protein